MQDINREISALEEKKLSAKTMDERLQIADKIHNLKMKRDGIKPTDSSIDCIGCGS